MLQEVSHVAEMDYVRILRDLREDADKTQTQIAEILGTSQTMYARYERGANELPIHHLITLSKYYGVSTDYLLGLSKDRWTQTSLFRQTKLRGSDKCLILFSILYFLYIHYLLFIS